jgi:hypothetical protein
MFLYLARARDFLISKPSKPDLGLTQTPVQSISRALSPGGKHLQHKNNHSSLCSAQAGNEWSYASTSILLTQTM